ncbi:citrate transporter [Anaerotignum sp. MB30-C6]|uniref:citrate transporter n=1 Tax=Anaerotignum sp. MB30-C6 TaxID=3070814 RepID=UPI0027DD3FE9|nr:citrate transporter [Anaerotignum sp. MB30-C6]WMI81892.1 citrate transporter [Anaerotignum sp. MB30-C6]
MQDLSIHLTPVHIIYLIGVVTILSTMVLRKDTPIVCVIFIFILGLVSSGNLVGGIQSTFQAILYASKEFMEIIATIALVTSLSKCLTDLGSDYLMMRSMSKIMKNSYVSWWILGITMMIFSLFLWPSPSVALVGAILVPLAVKKGLTPIAAAMALNLFGHGIALSSDVVIQGAPSITAASAGIEPQSILQSGFPLFLTMGVVTIFSAFIINRKCMVDKTGGTLYMQSNDAVPSIKPSKEAVFIAILTPLAFIIDIILMFVFDLKGGDATSLVSGTALLVMIIASVIGFKRKSLEKVTDYIKDGFLFAIKIFAPVIIIGGFFFIGGEGITSILGEQYQSGILNDWAIWLAGITPLNKYMVVFIQMVIGGLTGLDGSGFSGLPLVGALANTFGTVVNCSVPILATLGQISAIFVGGGTIVPWGLIPVAAICNVNPLELARKNLLPVGIGFLCTFILACILI